MAACFAACGSLAPTRGLVVVDESARLAGARIVVENALVAPAGALEAAADCHVAVVSAAGRTNLCVQPGQMLWVHGADATPTVVDLGRDVRDDEVLVRGTEPAVREMATQLGAIAAQRDDQRWSIRAPGAWALLPSIAPIEGIVDVLPVAVRETDPPSGSNGSSHVPTPTDTPPASESANAGGSSPSGAAGNVSPAPWFGGTAMAPSNGLPTGSSGASTGGYAGSSSSLAASLAALGLGGGWRTPARSWGSWRSRWRTPIYSSFEDWDDDSEGESNRGFRVRVVPPVSTQVRPFACGGAMGTRGPRDCTVIGSRARTPQSIVVAGQRAARETVIRVRRTRAAARG